MKVSSSSPAMSGGERVMTGSARSSALAARFGEASSVKVVWKPQTLAPADQEKAESLMKLVDALDEDDDVQTAKAKVQAGARFLITQIFYDNADYFSFVQRLRDERRFADIDALRGQIDADVRRATRLFTRMTV